MWWHKARRRKKRDKYLHLKRIILTALIIAQLSSYQQKIIKTLGKKPSVRRYITSLVIEDVWGKIVNLFTW